MSDLSLGVNVAGVADAIGALQRVGQAVEQATQTQTAHQQAVRDAVREGQVYNFNQERAAQATAAATTAQQAASQSAFQLGQRIAGAANAFQSLTSRLGGDGSTAGIIGAAANTSLQFAQLGLVLGPGGALVGGIAGAAIPVLEHLSHAFDDVGSHAATTARTVEQMVQHYESLQEASALTARLADGTATLEERQTAATRAQAIYADQVRTTTELQQRLATLEGEAQSRASLIAIGMTATEAARRVEVDAIRAQISASQDHTVALRDEANAATELTRVMTPLTEAQALEAQQDANDAAMGGRLKHGPAHTGGGQTRDARADDALSGVRAQIDSLESGPLAGVEAQTQALETAFDAAWRAAYDGSREYGTALQAVIDQLRETQTAQAETARASAAATAEETRNADELANLKAHYREVDERATADATSLRHKTTSQAFDEENATKAKLATEAHARTSMTQQATGQMIGDLTNVFTLIGEGQANAAQGAELLLASFLQYISQRATIEALAQVAQAIGSYPDPAGMALHAAAAVAWGAVAVATGVGANALQSDVQSQVAAQHQDSGATSRDTASPSREHEQAAGSNLTFYVMPGGYVTQKDVANGVLDGLNMAIRNGGRVDPRGVVRTA